MTVNTFFHTVPRHTVPPFASRSLQAISIVPKDTSENIYYPKESGEYFFEEAKCIGGPYLSFRTYNEGALFYRICMTKEGGKPGISIHSEGTSEMSEFLTQNEIPIKEWGSDCTYHKNRFVPFATYYYTTDQEVCAKLAKILLSKNTFNLTQADLEIIHGFKHPHFLTT